MSFNFYPRLIQNKKLRRFNYTFGALKGMVLAEHQKQAEERVKKLPFCLDGKIPNGCKVYPA